MVLEKVLKMENALIAGYLYQKLAEAEKAGITVRYKVEMHREYPVSEVQLIEEIGNLFAHATKKLAGAKFSEKKIYFKLQQKEEYAMIKFAYTSVMSAVDKVVVKLPCKVQGGKHIFRIHKVDSL